jgi:hypothetical protein
MRKKRYEDREKRLGFINFMESVKQTFPYSTTRDVFMTREEMDKSFLLTEIHETTQVSKIYFLLIKFGALRDFCTARPNRRKKKKGSVSIFVEFRNVKDAKKFWAKSERINLFEASNYDPLIDPIPRHKKGYRLVFFSVFSFFHFFL